jgi:uroporphyrinogen-III decarboxylase
VEKFQEGKFLGTELLNSAQDVLRARQVVQALMKKCTKLAAQMERAIAAGASSVKRQPSLISPRSEHDISYFVKALNSHVESWQIKGNIKYSVIKDYGPVFET